jgi:hypothetical protein
MARLMNRDELMAYNVRRYYEGNLLAWKIVAAYINGQPLPDGTQPLSLRSIDYFVRTLTQSPNARQLARSYNALKAGRHKQNFDPFRRSERTVVTLHGVALETTYAQLAFFMWMMQSGTLELAQANREQIAIAKRRPAPAPQAQTQAPADAQPRTATTTTFESAKKRKGAIAGPALASGGQAILSLTDHK